MVQILTIYNDEKEILDGIALGQKKSLEWVYKHCFATTKKMVIKLNGDTDEAWDVFQEAVTILYQKCSIDGIDLQCRINTYITSIARNLWLKRFKQITAIDSPEEWEDIEDVADDVDVYLQKEKDLTTLEAMLEKIGDPCSKMLKAFYFNKKSMQEICEDFGYTNADNAKTQKYKCLTRLKKLFFTAAALTDAIKQKNE
jgi:RNA polymerase sigma factor (sigma-70 family)